MRVTRDNRIDTVMQVDFGYLSSGLESDRSHKRTPRIQKNHVDFDLTENRLQNEKTVGLKIRNHDYTDRITFYNSFKKSNLQKFVDASFPPSLASIFPHLDIISLGDPNFEYVSVANQRFRADHIKEIRFLPLEELTPHKSIYLSKRPLNF